MPTEDCNLLVQVWLYNQRYGLFQTNIGRYNPNIAGAAAASPRAGISPVRASQRATQCPRTGCEVMVKGSRAEDALTIA